MRITQDNMAILRRIQQAQPVYNHIEWEEDFRKSFHHLKNTAEFPVVLRGKASSQGILSPMQVDSARYDVPRPGSGNKRSSAVTGETSDLGTSQELRYVFKEGKNIGNQYYLIEMATDGCTLAVSAYDGEAQQNLELVVNEQNHRKLHRECRGDYSLVADRLVVD